VLQAPGNHATARFLTPRYVALRDRAKIGRDPSERPAPREPRYHTPQFLQRATTTAPRDDDDDFDD
jgi:hypothetical protein